MAVTFNNEPLTKSGWHRVKTERGEYRMAPSWIDTASPRDMMDYDFTQTIQEGRAASADTHMLWCSMQVCPSAAEDLAKG